MRTPLFAVVPFLVAGFAVLGCGSKSEGPTDPSNLNTPGACPPGQFCPPPAATTTAPPVATTPPPAASSASSATPLPPLGAAAVTTVLTGMGQTAGEILKISESSFVDHLNGITLNFVLPGVGGVLQVIGNLNFADGTFSGRNTRGDTTAFCSYLLDP